MSKKLLVLFAHPSQHRSEVNQPLVNASRQQENTTVVDLYNEYPCYDINIEREQQRLREHDVIIMMFPLYWYSTPPILKEWQDLVLEYGFAYGQDGTELTGKTLICAVSAGGAEDAYRQAGYNHFSIRELLRPLEQTASLCGMHYLPPFVLFGSRTAYEEGRIDAHIGNWLSTMDDLREGNLNPNALKDSATINCFNQKTDEVRK